MHQPKPAPVLGGPEDAGTCWLLGYMHVSNLIEVIRSPLCWNETVFCQVTGLWWVCMVGCAAIALESLSSTKMLKYKCREARLLLNACQSAFLHQDVGATLNCSWCVLHVEIFLGGWKLRCSLWLTWLCVWQCACPLCSLVRSEGEGVTIFHRTSGKVKQESERSWNVTLCLEVPDVKRLWCLLNGFSPCQKTLMLTRLDVPAVYD